ncbi:Cation transport ATPase [Halapricum desulfuricans]|uniref:Cation transport ATPase n=1 Tax=Halapricum desulfuricans TaxID=2841257 RepID=A0A897NJT5_9EURY|nr:HAD-IC family P-type ATPase [Halapricum desulfuricans]QSG10536.1 Cation transport ATPase [Halapricum desulfuricans]
MVGTDWHAATVDEALEELSSGEDGLSTDRAARRLARHGPNTIGEEEAISPARIFLHQFTSPLIYVLLVAFVVTVAIDHYADAIVIALVLVINAAIGFAQEYRAENAMAALASLVAPKARVRRDGNVARIDSTDLVPGDIVLLESGDIVPADVRLIRTTELRLDTSILTGESEPVRRSTEPVEAAHTVVDRRNMAYMGTSVSSGRGVGVVVATGGESQIGTIAGQVRETARATTPLQTRMRRFGNLISVAVLAVALVLLGVGLWQAIPLADVFLLAVATAVSAIPEGLPVVMTVALAVSVRRMAGRNAIIRRLPAVETLGSCSVIVSDKTGTITENRMTVQRMWTADGFVDVTDAGDPDAGRFRWNGGAVPVESGTTLYETLLAGVLANEASLVETDEGELEPVGDPTETALLMAGRKAGLDQRALTRARPQVGHRPFESDRRYTASARTIGDRSVTYVKGAPERVVDMCETMSTSTGEAPIDTEAVLVRAEELADDGLRVIGMARGDGNLTDTEEPSGLTFLGFAGLIDPPRAGVSEAIEACSRAGIDVKMVTGDHAATARAISEQVGIDSDRVLTGEVVASLSDDELTARLRETAVFARITPAQKLRIVSLLQADGEIVAVTGDGVNDAPALKAAHIGAAMGISGTDVAKEASEMVLTDDNFATVYAAVEEGRTVFSNIRKATMFLLATGVALVLAILAAFSLAVAGVLPRDATGLFPLLLLPAQALWLNVVNNGIQDVALAFEPGEREQFERPPHRPDEGLLSRQLLERTVIVGVWLAALALAVFWYEFTNGASLGYAQTATLSTMVVSMALFLGTCRSESRSVLEKSPVSNPLLFAGTLTALAVHLLAIHAPPTQLLLGVEPIAVDTWIRILVLSPTVLLVAEAHKRWRTASRR